MLDERFGLMTTVEAYFLIGGQNESAGATVVAIK
jgi:hypothetical protein